MPVYKYRCQKCKSTRTVSHSMDFQPTLLCKRCGCLMHKVIEAPSVIYRGSGFYKTDHGKLTKKGE